MMAKAKVKADVVEDLDEEVTDDTEEMMSAKAAAVKLGTDGRTLRKFLRSKHGTIGQGKRWELDPDDFDQLKADFEAWGKGSRKKTDEPAKKKSKAKAETADADDEMPDADDLEEVLDDIEDLEDLEDLD